MKAIVYGIKYHNVSLSLIFLTREEFFLFEWIYAQISHPRNVELFEVGKLDCCATASCCRYLILTTDDLVEARYSSLKRLINHWMGSLQIDGATINTLFLGRTHNDTNKWNHTFTFILQDGISQRSFISWLSFMFSSHLTWDLSSSIGWIENRTKALECKVNS